MGDSLGEEALLLQPPPAGSKRAETARALQETFLFELKAADYAKLKDELTAANLTMDLFTISNYFKRQQVQKRSWKLYTDKQYQKNVKLY